MNHHDAIAEDTIAYELHYPLLDCQDGIIQNHPEFILGKLNDCLAFIQAKTHGVIWNSESFNLTKSDISTEPNVVYLYGTTHYGDNIDDEWFIIYLLYELSKLDEQLVIKLADYDGQTLLIETADHIPKWLDPDNSDNRVFVYRGKMHIIPREVQLNDRSQFVNQQKAIEYLRDNPGNLASSEAQAIIDKKLSRYPEYLKQQLHRARCYVPIDVASILDRRPQLISQAINSFYEHGVVQARPLRFMKHFTPEDRIMRTLTFTRHQYAKITHQNYAPDKRSGWKSTAKNSPEFKSHDIGLKLACGFEILLAGSKMNDKLNDNLPEETSIYDFDDDKKWKKYLNNLKSYNYFRDELEGSKLYCDLLKRAKESYFNSFIKEKLDHESVSPRNDLLSPEIAALLASASEDYDRLKEEETLAINQVDDDDSWLNVTAEQLDQLLEECFASTKASKNIGPQDVTKLMRNFINRKHSKIRIENSQPGVNMEESDSSSEMSEYSDEDEKLDGAELDELDDFGDEEGDFNSADGIEGSESDLEDIIESFRALGKDFNFDAETSEVDLNEVSKRISINDYMKLMDRELKSTNVGIKDFVPSSSKLAPKADLDSDDDSNEEIDENVKLDAASCHNLLEGYNAGLEAHQPGAACNILQSMGLLPSQAVVKEK